MSELHLSLAVIGLLFIAGVFFFNQWQEKKYRRQTEKMFRGERQDVLFEVPSRKQDGERIEPSFLAASPDADAKEALPASPYTITEVADTSVAPVQQAAVAVVETTIEEKGQTSRVIDEAIDLIGVIRLGEFVSADKAKSLISWVYTFSKPVHWEGMRGGQWREILSDNQYAELRIALQLADRRGPATSIDISRFIGLVKQFAVELGSLAQMETEESAALRATELDGFCADVDVEIGVNLAAGDRAMAATKLRALAESSGLKLNADGVFHFYNEQGKSLFTLRNSEPRPFLPDHVKNISTHGITLLLDVPRVAHGVQAFDQMLQLGRQIGNALGSEVVDDNGKPLTDAGADSIRRQLALIYREMESFGIPAGSPLALRLFS